MTKKGRLLVIQAHLDHPGGVVIGKAAEEEGKNLYAAVWYGSYRLILEGKIVSVCNLETGLSDECIIEKETNIFGERLVYFWSSNTFDGLTSVHCKGLSPSIDEKNKIISGWALDDILSCAILLEAVKNKVPQDVIGLLTLDEERGCCGIRSFAEMIEASCDGRKPVLINLEMPAEQDESAFVLACGIKIRTADARSSFSEAVLNELKKLLPNAEARAITSGGTEASVLAKRGWTVGSLALPVRFAHNGSKEGLWCEEDASLNDVQDMFHAVLCILRDPGALFDTKVAEQKPPAKDVLRVDVVDEASDIIEAIKASPSYGDYLIGVAGVWSQKLKQFGIRFKPMSLRDYETFRKSIMSGGVKIPQGFKGQAEEMLEKISYQTGITPKQGLNIYLLLSDGFNAKQLNRGFGLSVLRMNWDDLPRILCHELTHWLTGDMLRVGFARPILSLFIGEGLACYLSSQMLKLPPHCALNVSEQTFAYFCGCEVELKRLFSRIVSGSHIEIRGKRHRVPYMAAIWDPFKMSAENPFNKFGYYLGFKYFNYCNDKGYNADEMIHSPSLAEYLLLEYLRT